LPLAEPGVGFPSYRTHQCSNSLDQQAPALQPQAHDHCQSHLYTESPTHTQLLFSEADKNAQLFANISVVCTMSAGKPAESDAQGVGGE